MDSLATFEQEYLKKHPRLSEPSYNIKIGAKFEFVKHYETLSIEVTNIQVEVLYGQIGLTWIEATNGKGYFNSYTLDNFVGQLKEVKAIQVS